MAKKFWQKAKYRLIPTAVLLTAGIISSSFYYNVTDKSIEKKLIAYCSITVFAIAAILLVHSFTSSIYSAMARRRLGIARAASIQFGLRIFGYVIILLGSLGLMHIPVGKLLLGGAVIGIILGVAAQQSLGNFFASIVLIIAHPFRVGEDVILFSGALGGKYEGVVTDIGLTHTKLKQADGKIVFMPNSALLAGAAIIPNRPQRNKHNHQ